MATTTTNLTLRRELATERYDVDVTLNGNWNLIDAAFGASAKGNVAGVRMAMIRDVAVTPSYTGSDALSTLNLNPTWNTTGTMRGMLINVVHTAAGASSRIFELQRDGVSVFDVNITSQATGVTTLAGDLTVTGTITGTLAAGGVTQYDW